MTTSQLKRQQSQLVPRHSSAFGSRGNSQGPNSNGNHNKSNSANPKAYASLCNSSSYSTLSPLTTLDEDKRREAIFSESVGSSGSCLIYNQQHVLVFSDSNLLDANLFSIQKADDFSIKRRCSMSMLDESFTPIASLPAIGRRRYSTSSTDKITIIKSSDLPQNILKNTIPEPLELNPLESSNVQEPSISVKPLSSALEATPNLKESLTFESQKLDSPQSINSTQSFGSNITPLTPPEPDTAIYSFQKSHSSNLLSSIESDSFESVLSSYNQFFIHNTLPTTQDLEAILTYLENTTSVSSTTRAIKSLEIYTDSLSKGVKPSVEVYSSVISNLVSTASTLQSSVSSPLYSSISRHAKNPYFLSSTTGVPVISSLKSLITESHSSSSFVKLALDIFYASNSVHVQEYSYELYASLIKACVENGQERALYSIIRAYESKYTTLGPQAYISLVKGYGRYADVTAITECYKFYKFHAHKFGKDNKAVEMYAALATAFFDANVPGAALAFLSKLLAQSQSQIKDIQKSFSIHDIPEHLKVNPESLIGSAKTAKYKKAVSQVVSSLLSVVSAIVLGFAKLGDFKSCWKWIQRVDSDPFLPAVDIPTLVSVMKYTADANVLSVSEKLFDYMASRKDSLTDSFNGARSDFLLLCVRTHNTNLLMKAIKESQIRSGTWDLMTTLYVTKYLVRIGETDLAAKVFNQQSERYTSYVMHHDPASKEILDVQATETLAEFLNILQQAAQLNVKITLSLAKSSFFSARSFFGDKGGQSMLQTLWKDFENNSIELHSLDKPQVHNDELDIHGNIVSKENASVAPASSLTFTLADIIGTHLVWIKACSADNSLGGLSIPYPLLDHLKENFARFVKLLIKEQSSQNGSCFFLSPGFVSDVKHALDKLEDKETKKEWIAFCQSQTQEVESKQVTEVIQSQQISYPASSLPWDTAKTSAVCLLATQPNTLYKAFYELEASVANKILLGAEAYVNIIENAASQKAVALIQSTYKLALNGLPHPNEQQQAWTAWATIHRAVVARTASLDKHLAIAAYSHLLEMGASPCATGYGQMIANNVTLNSPSVPPSTVSEFTIQEDAAEALRLFQESKNRGVPPNTFLYNVVLAKLTKARNFGAVFSVFQDMEFTQTARNSVTYGTMIHASCLAGDEKQALKLFEDMESSPFYTPKVAPFNALLQFYVQTKKDRNAALKIYDQLKKRAESGAAAIQPSEHTYKLLIDAFTLIGPVDINAADRVLLEIVANKSSVTTRHYASLIYARGVVCRNIPAARQFYEGLTEQRRVRPDRHIFQAVIESLVACAQEKDVTAVLKEMITYGVDLDDAYLSDLLIRAWSREDLRKSVGLFEHCLQIGITDPSVFEAVVRAYAYHNDIASIHSVFSLMKTEFGYRDDVIVKLENEIISKFMGQQLSPEHRESILSESSFRNKDSHALRVLETAKQSMLERNASRSLHSLNSWTVLDKLEDTNTNNDQEDRKAQELNERINPLDIPDVKNKPSLVEF